ncbi:MAG: heavy metal transporter [Flavobacteriaceae bacterium]|nr:heavy metal transporter [Flavobacteriaceae bacterium]
MTKTYKISGMTCEGCVSSVEERLSKLPKVNSVKVDLEKAEAVISSEAPIAISSMSEVLAPKYGISEPNIFQSVESNTSSISEEKSKLQQLKPLFLIFGYILIASIMLNYKAWDTSSFMLDFMGLFYIIFSFFKLLDLKGFPESFRMYDPLAKVVPFYAWIYPFIEVALGLMFLMRYEITAALIITIVILGITTIGVTRTLLNKSKIQCACLGTALKLPMTEATFIENSIMIVMAWIMLIKTAAL